MSTRVQRLAFCARSFVARGLSIVFPFAHRIGETLLASAPEGLVLQRRFFGQQLMLEVGRSAMHRLLYLKGGRCIHERHLLRQIVQCNGVVVEAGANIGYYMLLLRALVGPAGHVICYEPDPDNLRELRRNVAVNGAANVSVLGAALGAEQAAVRWVCGINGYVSVDGSMAAEQVTLDESLPESTYSSISTLVIDVEGDEASVLRGASRLIAARRPSLFVEIHPWIQGAHSFSRILDLVRSYYSDIRVYRRVQAKGLTRAYRALANAPGIEALHLAEAEAMYVGDGIRERLWLVATAG